MLYKFKMNKIENNLNSYNTMMGGANAATAAFGAGAAPPGAVPPGAVPPEAAATALWRNSYLNPSTRRNECSQ